MLNIEILSAEDLFKVVGGTNDNDGITVKCEVAGSGVIIKKEEKCSEK